MLDRCVLGASALFLQWLRRIALYGLKAAVVSAIPVLVVPRLCSGCASLDLYTLEMGVVYAMGGRQLEGSQRKVE